MSDDNFNFEDSLQQLENLVKQMEQGNLSLKESLQAFEQGIALTRQCQQALDTAEQKVQILMQDATGQLHEKPLSQTSLSTDV